MNLHTRDLTGTTMNITRTNGVYKVSVLASGGDITVSGNFSFQGAASDPVILKDGQGIVVSTTGTQPIDGLVIDPQAATAKLMVFFN
jgi:hypothetical protein